jgi:outer membrane protein assembly factor BamB
VANGLRALSRDGSLLWKARIEGRMTSAPVIAPSGTVYLTAGGALHAVSPEGSVRWSVSLGASAMSTPAVEADGTVYAVGDGLVSVYPGGTVQWRMPLGASGLAGHPTIGPEGNILVASADTLYSVAPSGSLRWSQSIGSSESSPAVDRFGRVYIGSTALGGEPQFRCVNGRNGGTLWSFPLRIASDSPPAVDAERRVFFGSDEGVFYAVDRYGLLLWHLELNEPPFRVQTRFPRDREDASPDAHAHVDTPPAIGPAGRLVFGLSRAAPPGGTYRLFVIAPAGR